MSWPNVNSSRRRRRLLGACLATTVLVAGCGSSPTPSAADVYPGSWSGTLRDDQAGSGTFEMTLRLDTVLAGTWSASVADQNPSGTLTADSLNGANRSFAVTCTVGANRGSLLLVASVSGQSMTGSYRSFQCPGMSTGTISLARR